MHLNIKTKTYDVILTRADAIAPFPRLERSARCLQQYGLNCLAVGWDREGCHPKVECGYFDIIRVHFPGKYGGGIRNLFGLLCWNLWLLFLHLRLRPKVIHAYDFDTVLPALIAKIFIGCKVVYDIADWYAGSRKVGWLKLLFEEAERWAIRRADLLILAHEERLQQVGFNPRKWLVIYNIPEDRHGSLRLVDDIEEIKNGDYFVYVGVLHSDRGLEQIVEAATISGLKLIIAGFGPLAPYCQKVSKERKHIKFLGKIPYEYTLALESNAIAIIALYDPKISNNQLAAPNKFYEAMMLGRPLITSKDTLVGRIVERERLGIAVTYGNISELAKAFMFLKENPKCREEMGRRARALYETQYSPNKQCEKLYQAYQQLCPELLCGEG